MISKEELFEQYIVQKKTIKQIADEKDLAVGTIFNYLKKYEIKTRPAMTEEVKMKISQSKKGQGLGIKKGSMPLETKIKISLSRKGKIRKPSKYGGYIKQRTDGYYYVFCPNHPRANKDGLVPEHTLIVEEKIGRYLKDNEEIHHINHIRNDNRIENLKLMTKTEHRRFHLVERLENNYKLKGKRKL